PRLRGNVSRLESRLRLAVAPEPALGIAINKEQTLAIARGLGLCVPREVVVRDGGDLPAALKDIGLPAVIKPSESWLWNEREGARPGAQLAVTPTEARHAVGAVTGLGEAALLQPLLTGRREAVSFLYANGEVYARFAQWAKRTSPPLGGNSVLRQSIAVPADIGGHAESLVREINLEGYSEVEFRRDAAGVPYLMEINPRLSASVEVAVRAGVDFPYLLYQWASGEPIDRVAAYRTGGWIRALGGDVTPAMAALRGRGRGKGVGIRMEKDRAWSPFKDVGVGAGGPDAFPPRRISSAEDCESPSSVGRWRCGAIACRRACCSDRTGGPPTSPIPVRATGLNSSSRTRGTTVAIPCRFRRSLTMASGSSNGRPLTSMRRTSH